MAAKRACSEWVMLSPTHEHPGGLAVVVIEEKALAGIQRGDPLHVLFRQFEVEDVDVLLHPFPVGGLRDDDGSPLDQPAKGNLRDGLAILRRRSQREAAG